MPRTDTPSIRLRPEMNKALEDHAERANMPKTAFMRLLLSRGLDDIDEQGLGAVVADSIDAREREREAEAQEAD